MCFLESHEGLPPTNFTLTPAHWNRPPSSVGTYCNWHRSSVANHSRILARRGGAPIITSRLGSSPRGQCGRHRYHQRGTTHLWTRDRHDGTTWRLQRGDRTPRPLLFPRDDMRPPRRDNAAPARLSRQGNAPAPAPSPRLSLFPRDNARPPRFCCERTTRRRHGRCHGRRWTARDRRDGTTRRHRGRCERTMRRRCQRATSLLSTSRILYPTPLSWTPPSLMPPPLEPPSFSVTAARRLFVCNEPSLD